MTDHRQHANVYKADFAKLGESTVTPQLLTIRRQALDRFLALGFPTTRNEEWRFTNVAPIARTPFRLAGGDSARIDDRVLNGETLDPGWPRLAFTNAHATPACSSARVRQDSLVIESLAGRLASEPRGLPPDLTKHASFDQEAFTALNTAFLDDGAYVVIPRNLVFEDPIHLIFVSAAGGNGDATVSHPRSLIVIEPGSQATIIESYVGLADGVYLTNAVTEIIVGHDATIDHYKIVREEPRSYHIGATQIHLSRNSTVSSHTISIGGALVRNNITAVLDGEGAQCTLNGLYVTCGREHVDNHLRVEHAKPHCDSREFFKGILDDNSRGVFTGRIIVHPDAQKTDAKQTNMNLLLAEGARIDTKPQLEIFANDVKCTHGATIGQLDADAIFYLRSRGLAQETARAVLIHAFAGESVEKIRPQPLRRQLQQILLKRLPHGELLQEAV